MSPELPESPKPDVPDMAQILHDGSEFARNGFAGLDIRDNHHDDDAKSEAGGSLFGGRDKTPPEGTIVKAEEDGPANSIKPGLLAPSVQNTVLGSSNTMKTKHDTAAKDTTPSTRLARSDDFAIVSTVKKNNSPIPQPSEKMASIETDDDDDLMIVDEADVPAHVKAKFSANPWKHVTPDLEITCVRVKKEPGIAGPDVKDEPPSNGGSLFGDDNIPDMDQDNRGGSAAALGRDDDDEAMFVDELDADAATEEVVPMVVDNAGAHAENEKEDDVMADVGAADVAPGIGPPLAVDAPDNEAVAPQELNATQEAAAAAAAVGPDAGNDDDEANGHGADDDSPDDDGAAHGADDDAGGPSADDHIAPDGGDGDGEFVVGDDHELSDGEQPRPRRRKPPPKRKAKRTGPDAADDADFQDIDELSPENMVDELELIAAERNVFAQRKAKGMLGQGDASRLQSLQKRYSILKDRITEPQRNVANVASEKLREMMEMRNEDESGDDNGQPGSSKQGASANRLPAIARRANKQSASRKRPWKPMPGSSDPRSKKQRTKRSKPAKYSSTTSMILKMVRSEDPIIARSQIDDMQLFDNFEASTIKDQMKRLKDQVRRDPDADLKRILGEFKQLQWARAYFRGRKHCKPKDGFWLITGLKKPLHHYQLYGAGWMLHRELHPDGPFGGILADQVGLGKTIEALACILGNAPSPDDPPDGFGTLVVCPPNIIGQWRQEIHQCSPHLNVVVYHSNKLHRVWMEDLQKADIVLTTYQEVGKGYPSRDKVKEMDALEVGQRAAQFAEALGTLFTIKWRRVILDEAHAIKNHRTHTSKACIQLEGKYRWALTATPIHNGVHEIYPYMLFIRSPAAESCKDFSKKTKGVTLEHAERIKEMFGDVLMLRQLSTLFLGKALFEMPRTHPLPNSWIDLSEEETIIYRRIESKVRDDFNRAMEGRDGPKRKSLTSFLSVIIRLRQAVTHPFMLFSMMRDMFDLEDIKAIRKQFTEIKEQNPDRPFIDQLGRWCETRLDDGRLVGQVIPSNQEGPFGKGEHGLSFVMEPQLEQMEKSKALGGSICSICDKPCVTPCATKCDHVFCRTCLEELIEAAREEEHNTLECPTCHAEHDVDEIMVAQGSRRGSQSQSRRRRGKASRSLNPHMPGNDCNSFQPIGDPEGAKFLEECDSNVDLAMAASAKTAVVKDIVLNWQAQAAGDKIIVFTQWVMVGRILGRVLEQEQIKFLYYFGEMSREEKEDNIKDFHQKPEIKVLIASLKCGGQGLNLTCANRVIMIDPWWNSAIEHQAYGRVFRMGQLKETYYVRLLTRKTIDGRMAKLQNEKLRQINSVVEDYDTTRQSLKFEEVAELFGRVRRDEEGNAIAVESDYDTDEEEALQDEDEEDNNDNNGGKRGPDSEPEDGPGVGFGDSVVNGYGIQDLM